MGSSSMSVSAVIPTYNRRTQVLRAIDSVFAQTIPVDEVIVVDDGSTDGTCQAILGQYGARVTLIRQENLGVSAARNKAVEYARGSWVAFLDSDDVWHPAKIERQFEALDQLGDGFGVCFTNCKFTGTLAKDANAFENAGLKVDSAFGPLSKVLESVLARECGIYVQSSLVVRALLIEIGGFDENLGLLEDADIFFRLSFKTRFCFVAEPLVTIDRTANVPRLTSDLVQKQRQDKTYQWMELFATKILVQKDSLDPNIWEQIQKGLIDFYYGWAAERLRVGRFIAAFCIIRKIRQMGKSYRTIGRSLLFRARRRLFSKCGLRAAPK